ncbi:MAG TPA: PPOX class F420-dependent oxidoreductase [Candidatus Saccharimonadia bacterium]|jgi:PPOX class probable F420-dependent enzyme
MSKITDSERQILSGKNFVFVATLNPDGSPQVSPVWADVEGDDLVVINTERHRVKARNLEHDKRVALAAVSQDDPYDKVSLRGEVAEITEDGAREHINKLSQKYLGKPYPWLSEGDRRVIIKIRKL